MRLGNYKGLHVRMPDLTVREEEIDKVLQREQHRNAVIVHIDEGDEIRKVREVQPLDDDFARDFSDCDTLAQWREVIREELEERRAVSAEEKVQRKLLSAIIDDSDIPIDRDLEEEVSSLLYDEFLMDLEDRGISLELYLKRSGRTEEQIRESRRKEALFAIRSESVLHAIAERENLTVLPDEVADELTAMAEEEGEDPAAFAESFDDEDINSLWDEILLGKAMDIVMEYAVFDE